MLANKGYREAFKSNQPLSLGLNTYKGHVTNKGVAEAFEMEYKSVEEALQL
ncbi:alanine dehydrogenase 2 [Staphylococcus aureus]|uniref:Alanine dehydrogenase 2 n=5 Tax=Bacilli TaxID=91061 RepID=A0A1D4Z5N6_STAAU|nr:alanine dehydrogenase [Staphylococcus aureus]SUK52330.1 alanine dehydrogenase 2 [Staphylococcus aureus]